MNTATKRRHRRQANAALRNHKNRVRHTRVSGRTGSVHSKQLASRRKP